MTFQEEIQQAYPDIVILSNPDETLGYSGDYSEQKGLRPKHVIYPSHIDHVELILKKANQYAQPIIARGAGTGKAGSVVVTGDEVVVSLEKMNRLIEVDPVNRVAVVEPGLITQVLQNEVEKKGLFYPPDPASLAQCSIGGNVAVNAGGPSALKYGVTRHFVIGIEGVFANGERFSLGGKLHKNVAGYDLLQLLIGSEGTLAIITKLTLKLLQKPSHQACCMVGFNGPEEAWQWFQLLLARQVQPSFAEWVPQVCLDYVSQYLKTDIQSHPIQLFIGLDAFSEQELLRQKSQLQGLDKGVVECQFNSKERPYETIMTIRRDISPALTAGCRHKVSEDITVPLSEIPRYLAFLSELNQESQEEILAYGHVGDGNLHVNILNHERSLEEWQEIYPKTVKRLLLNAIALGGTISGEHGVGLSKREYLPLYINQSELTLMKQIKAQFDPRHILNPGKLF